MRQVLFHNQDQALQGIGVDTLGIAEEHVEGLKDRDQIFFWYDTELLHALKQEL